MSEKKNKVNVKAAVISAIVILALAGGGLFGYMYYSNVYLPAEYEKKYVIEDVDYPVDEYKQTVGYYFVGYADVTTEHAVGDLSDMGIFGNEGETVRVKIIATGSDFGISEVNLERVE